MDEATFKRRTKQLGLDVIRLVAQMPRDTASQVIGRQIVRSATSVGANYRAACRGKSVADVVAKLGIVEEECDETGYWLELIVESGALPPHAVAPTADEAHQILAMTVASIKTLRSRSIQNPKSKIQNG